MPSKRPRAQLSLGSVLTLCLTALVAVGCVFVFGKIQGQNPEAKMSAERVIDLVGSALHGATPEPLPLDENVRTVTVTLAPKKTPDPIPPLSPADNRAVFVAVNDDFRDAECSSALCFCNALRAGQRLCLFEREISSVLHQYHPPLVQSAEKRRKIIENIFLLPIAFFSETW